MSATCATCKWHHANNECRRFPPTQEVTEWHYRDGVEATAWRIESRWPETNSNDFCGEHDPAEAK